MTSNVQISWFFTALLHLNITDMKKTNIWQRLIFFVKMKLQAHFAHINAIALIWLTSVVSSRESPNIFSSEEINNIRTAFEKFGVKRNHQLKNRPVVPGGAGGTGIPGFSDLPTALDNAGLLELLDFCKLKYCKPQYLGMAVSYLVIYVLSVG